MTDSKQSTLYELLQAVRDTYGAWYTALCTPGSEPPDPSLYTAYAEARTKFIEHLSANPSSISEIL